LSPITIIFSTSTSILSRLIRRFTRSQTSHTAIGTEMHGVPVVIEATVGGVRIFPRARWQRGRPIVAEARCLLDLERGLAHAIEHVGDRYDYKGLVGNLFVLIARWLGKKIKNPLASPKAVICSELVLHLDHEGHVPEWKGLDPEATTPEDLLRLCRIGQSFALLPPCEQTVGK